MPAVQDRAPDRRRVASRSAAGGRRGSAGSGGRLRPPRRRGSRPRSPPPPAPPRRPLGRRGPALLLPRPRGTESRIGFLPPRGDLLAVTHPVRAGEPAARVIHRVIG